MKNLYLVLAIAGAVIPYVFFVKHFQADGVSLGGFLSALFVNGAAGGFTADLLITSAVFWIWMAQQHARGKGPPPWLFVVINLTIGLSCALPGYLWWRERNSA